MRIVLIHAMQVSVEPIAQAFAEIWPTVELVNLLDDSLPRDLTGSAEASEGMTRRFIDLARYAEKIGSNGILFTCSAFGPYIEAAARKIVRIPVLKPNEALIEEAQAYGKRIGLLATFPTTLASMPNEFPPRVEVAAQLTEGALAALNCADPKQHGALAARTACRLVDFDVIALAQFSLARVAAATRPVITTPASAARKMKRLLEQRFGA